MDRADRQGLGLALAGHLALLAALVFGLFTHKPVTMPQADTMTVQLVPEAALRSAAHKASREAPAPPKAEEAGKPEDAAPPPPSPKSAPTPAPTPSPPVPAKPSPPKPTPPKPTPPKPTPPKPVPAPEPKPAPRPKPAPPKPAPPKPAPPKPAPPKPAPAKKAPAKPEKTAPAKSAPDKTAPAKNDKSAPAKPAKPTKAAKSDDRDFTLPSDLRGRRRPDEDERATGTGKSGKAAKKTGSLLGSDFSKDIAAAAKDTKGSAPQASQVSPRAMSGLIGIIAAQVKPCYNPPAGGADAGQIVTLLSIRMNRDGSVASVAASSQTGVNGSNGAYAKQMADAARRAVLRCSPLKLPAELYEGGWEDFDFRFRPEQMQ